MATICVIIIIIVSVIWFLIRTKKTNLPPGPKRLPIIGHLHLLGKNPHHALHRLSKKHGPVMFLRLGLMPTVVVSSPAAAELVLKTHDLVFASRPTHQVSKHICYDQRNLIFARYGPYWRSMRKLCSMQLFSSAKIDQFRDMRRAELVGLVDVLQRASDNRETVDISKKVWALSGDMTCLMVFGRTCSDDNGFKAVIDETMRLAGLMHLADYFPFMGAIDPMRRMRELGKTFDRFLERIIDDHDQDKKTDQIMSRGRDFVDEMMGVMESGESGFQFDRRHVKAVLVDMLIAGTETSAASVEWALSELIRHPTCMIKLQKELEQAVGMDQSVEESHLDKLEYLDLVVKETFRLHPASPLLVHESVEDCTLDGHHVPKGSRLLVNLMSIGRDPDAWNLDPENFVPERFVGSNIDLRGHDFKLLPFGSGRRGCPGMQLGLTVVRLVLAQLVHSFNWELPSGMLPSDLDMDEHFGLVTRRENHLTAVPTYRLLK